MSCFPTCTVQDDKTKNTADAAFSKVLRLTDVRDRSIFEMRSRLLREGFAEEHVSDAIERAILCGALDDVRFSGAYIRGKLRAGWGFCRIERCLKSFGVDTASIEGYPEAFYSAEDEVERAVKELTCFMTKAKDPRGARYRRLLSKGYSSDVIQTALVQFEKDDCD